jgi:hypothetical protein
MIAGIGSGIAFVGDVVGSILPNPDADRFAKTEAWYRDALAGDASDLCRLKYYSGRFGSHDCGTGIISGWATQPAKDYAYLLYNQAVAVLSGQVPATAPVPKPDSVPAVANTLATISNVAGQVAAGTGYIASSLGAQTDQQRQIQAALNIGKWVLIGGFVLLIGYLVFRARRR